VKDKAYTQAQRLDLINNVARQMAKETLAIPRKCHEILVSKKERSFSQNVCNLRRRFSLIAFFFSVRIEKRRLF